MNHGLEMKKSVCSNRDGISQRVGSEMTLQSVQNGSQVTFVDVALLNKVDVEV